MSTYPSTPQKPARFDLYAGKFRAICEMHGVKTGSQEDLQSFLTTLAGDRHFGMDFWGLIGKLSDHGGGELSDEQVFALVVEGVTGSAISADNDPVTKPLFAELRALLAGVDVHKPEPLAFPTPARTTPVASIDEARQRRYSASLPLIPQPIDAETIQAAGALPLQLQLAIESLEIVTRELKDRLDKLDGRLVRLESRAKESQSRPKDLVLNERREQDLKSAEKQRLVLEPAESPVEKHPSPNLFEGYAPERDRRWRKDVSLALMILICVAVGLLWQRYNGKIHRFINAIVQEELATPVPPPSPPTTPAPDTTSGEQSEAASTEQPDRTLQGVSTPPAADADSRSAARPSASLDRAATRGKQDSPSFSSAVSVSPAEMERHLILSRVPVYPEAARNERVEGSVVAQTLISKTGAVSRVLVIEGDSRLRNAAAEAIYKRRYRPYLVHRQPVDVATTVTVNFKLGG